MSFSSSVKNEICDIPFRSKEHVKCEFYGFLLFSKFIDNNSMYITLENKNIIDRILSYVKYLNVKYGDINLQPRRSSFSLYIHNCDEIRSIINNKKVNPGYFKYLPDFLRGVFLSCGNISNPNSDYHLEFVISDINLGMKLFSILENIKECKFKTNSIIRNKNLIIYIKGSEYITDFLTFIGATKSSMEFMQVKMIHETRNYINRTNNFETANITKTVSAAALQIKAINKIKEKVGLDVLPDSLKEIALLRIQNPYISLEELSLILSKPISKSGVNHRLKKLIKISDVL